MEFLYIIQAYEWIAMIFIICSQRNKRIEEIYFDKNHSSLKGKRKYENKSEGNNTTVRDEKCLMGCFIFYIVLRVIFDLFVTVTQIVCTNL